MADRFGTNYGKTTTFPPDKIPMVDALGKLYTSYDEYDLSTGVALVSGDLIYMMKIPAGARIVNAILHAAAPNGTTLLVGQIAPGQLETGAGTSNAGLIGSTAIAAVPVIAQMGTTAANAFQFLLTTSEMQIGIKVAAGVAGVVGKIRLMVIFAMS